MPLFLSHRAYPIRSVNSRGYAVGGSTRAVCNAVGMISQPFRA